LWRADEKLTAFVELELLRQAGEIFRNSPDMKTRIPPVVITIAFACFALIQNTQAVSPPPPGGYPNFTTAAGDKALQALTSGVGNTAIGNFSLFSVTTGNFNTAVGAGSLDLNTADSNTATGAAALLFNTTGTANTANGTAALEFNETGSNNTATGTAALFSNTTGGGNTANGFNALFNNTNGILNTAIGVGALGNNTMGSENTALGLDAGNGVTTATNVICIGALGADVSNSCFIGNIRDVTTQNPDAVPVVIDSAGQLGTASSSRRFKKEIKPMDKASEAILALKPVTFHYKSDTKDTPQFGLIAEDVAEVNPDLVVRDKNGEIYTVRYDAVNAMLLNEFLKEHHTVQEQQATITQLESTVAEQKKDFQATVAQLTARLDEQASQIQRVSAQLEASKPAPQVVNNP
jgi:Chaperone of endosialidase